MSPDDAPPTPDTDRRPVLRVVRGDATAEEIAAVLALVLARVDPGPAGPTGPSTRWGGGGWRAATSADWRTSYWPR